MTCVYADFVHPGFIGDKQMRYLRIIPMRKFDSTTQSHEFRHPIYCPINEKYIEAISIIIADLHGEVVQLKESHTPTYILIHFKQM